MEKSRKEWTKVSNACTFFPGVEQAGAMDKKDTEPGVANKLKGPDAYGFYENDREMRALVMKPAIRKLRISVFFSKRLFCGNSPQVASSTQTGLNKAYIHPKLISMPGSPIALLALFMVTQVVYGQRDNVAKKPLPPPYKKEVKGGEDCIKRNGLSFTDRLKKYPFNSAAQIQFVSFDDGVYLIDNEIIRKDSLPAINDTMLYSRLKEVKTLTFSQVDKLTDILYNYGFRGGTYAVNEAACYRPRNAILFLDSNKKVFELIEICFECRKTTQSSGRVSAGEMCEQKLDMLFGLFKDVGIAYGITKGVVPAFSP